VEEIVVTAIVCGKEKSDGCGSCRCTSQSDVLRVTSKLANVLLDPLQSLDLIFETVVCASTLDDLVGSQESIRTDAVVEVYNHDIVVACFDQARAIVVRVGVCVEATALNEKVDRERVVRSSIRRSENIDEKTILRRGIARCGSSTQTKVSRLSHHIVSSERQCREPMRVYSQYQQG
jgi:hypothetical protein